MVIGIHTILFSPHPPSSTTLLYPHPLSSALTTPSLITIHSHRIPKQPSYAFKPCYSSSFAYANARRNKRGFRNKIERVDHSSANPLRS
jgi:hypothetical protein